MPPRFEQRALHRIVGVGRGSQQADREAVREWKHGLYELQELPLTAGSRFALHYMRNAHSNRYYPSASRKVPARAEVRRWWSSSHGAEGAQQRPAEGL